MQPTDGCSYLFTCSDKTELLHWIQAMGSATTLDASPLLLQASGGVVLQASFLDCQEFAHKSNGSDQLNPLFHRNLAGMSALAGLFAAVDYGRQWVVLRSCGLLQCVEAGRPETLLTLADCCKVKVQNPQELREGSEYSIELETLESHLVLRAETALEHGDWVLAMEKVLQLLGLEEKISGHRNRESSYVTLKRLLLGEAGPSTYSLPRCLDDTEDLYEAPTVPSGLKNDLFVEHDSTPPENTVPLPPCDSTPTDNTVPLPPCDSTSPDNMVPLPPRDSTPPDNTVPLPPRDYLPPPLPPRDDHPPPLPPKGLLSQPCSPGVDSNVMSDSMEMDDDYILMQPSPGPSPSHPPHLTPTMSHPISIPSWGQPTKCSLLPCQNSEPHVNATSSLASASRLCPLTSSPTHTTPHPCNGEWLSGSHTLPYGHTPSLSSPDDHIGSVVPGSRPCHPVSKPEGLLPFSSGRSSEACNSGHSHKDPSQLPVSRGGVKG